MDGEWEPALISNPACEAAAGCGPWKAPMIDNPAYKGKWRAPLIANPAYKGKWAPRRIANPAYFLDSEPFKMTSIVSLDCRELAGRWTRLVGSPLARWTERKMLYNGWDVHF